MATIAHTGHLARWERFLRNTMSFQVSAAFHIVLLMSLACVMVETGDESELCITMPREPLNELAMADLETLFTVEIPTVPPLTFETISPPSSIDEPPLPLEIELELEEPNIELEMEDFETPMPKGWLLDARRVGADVKEVVGNASETPHVMRRLHRAGGQSGEVQVSLIWYNRNDLDLHVQCPSGETIFFGHKQSLCGGRLDVDMNVRGETREPVENIFWRAGTAPVGEFRVYVNHFENNGDRDPSRFSVMVRVTGETAKTYRGQLRHGDPQKLICSFVFGDDWQF